MLKKLSSELLSALILPPEWMQQRLLISEGKATWDDFSFEARTCKGFYLPYLFGLESAFAGRWEYWLNTLLNDAPLDTPIPRINFCDGPDPAVLKISMNACKDFLTRG